MDDDWKKQVIDGKIKFDKDFLCDCGYLSDVQSDEYSSRISSVKLIEVANVFNMMPIMKTKFAEVKAFEKELDDKKQKKRDFETFEALKINLANESRTNQ